jgi:hypothetical protein
MGAALIAANTSKEMETRERIFEPPHVMCRSSYVHIRRRIEDGYNGGDAVGAVSAVAKQGRRTSVQAGPVSGIQRWVSNDRMWGRKAVTAFDQRERPLIA